MTKSQLISDRCHRRHARAGGYPVFKRLFTILSILNSQGVLSILKKDGAKPPARRGCSAYASESDIHKSSIFNLQFRPSTFQLPTSPTIPPSLRGVGPYGPEAEFIHLVFPGSYLPWFVCRRSSRYRNRCGTHGQWPGLL